MKPQIEHHQARAAFQTLGKFLQEDGWHPVRVEDKFIYRMGFSGRNAEYTCYAQILVDLEQFLFYVLAPVKAPQDKRLVVAEFITRVNYELLIGNFELDFNDGEIRYKSSLDFEGTALTHPLIRRAIYPPVRSMDRYFPGLMSVMFADEPVLDAIAAVEEA